MRQNRAGESQLEVVCFLRMRGTEPPSKGWYAASMRSVEVMVAREC